MLKKLKSLFTIEEEENAHAGAGDLTPEKGDAADADIETEESEGEVNEKFLKILARAIEDSNQEGFDYFEFREFIKALNTMEMDEATRFKSAYANAQIMGATLDRLKDSARHYLEVLKREKGKFEAAAENRRTTVLRKRKQDLHDLEQSILSKQQMIEQLQNEIEELKRKVGEKRGQIEDAERKVAKTSSDFMLTYQHLVEQIENDVDKIHTYLS